MNAPTRTSQDAEARPEPKPDQLHVELRRELQQPPRGLVGELWGFIRHEKKWWMIPIVVALLLLVVLAILAGSPAAPLIYTLF